MAFGRLNLKCLKDSKHLKYRCFDLIKVGILSQYFLSTPFKNNYIYNSCEQPFYFLYFFFYGKLVWTTWAQRNYIHNKTFIVKDTCVYKILGRLPFQLYSLVWGILFIYLFFSFNGSDQLLISISWGKWVFVSKLQIMQ